MTCEGTENVFCPTATNRTPSALVLFFGVRVTLRLPYNNYHAQTLYFGMGKKPLGSHNWWFGSPEFARLSNEEGYLASVDSVNYSRPKPEMLFGVTGGGSDFTLKPWVNYV